MRKSLIIALALTVAGASFASTDGSRKKKKKEAQLPATEVIAPVVLTNGSDSLSYAAGMMATQGLIDFLQQQLGIDTAYMADFVKGFNQQVSNNADPHTRALAAGYQIGQQVKDGMLGRIKTEFTDTPDVIIDSVLFRGFTDAAMGDTTVMHVAAADEFFKQKQQYNQQVKSQQLIEAGRQYLAANAQKEGVICTPSGLQYKVLVKGEGPVPQPTDKVKVHYEGRLTDGTVFDASSRHGSEPISFVPTQVIKGWTEALTMMPVGSKWQLYIPQELAYGERGTGNIPPYSTLIFDVELVGIGE